MTGTDPDQDRYRYSNVTDPLSGNTVLWIWNSALLFFLTMIWPVS